MKQSSPLKQSAPLKGKRTRVLIALLLLAALTWGGLLLRDRQWHRWLATAPRAELARYVADHPDQPEAVARLGVLTRNAGEKAEAEKLLRHAVEIAPQEESDWIELSRALDDKEAIQELETYLKTTPDSAPVTTELVRRYLQAGDMTRARSLAERAMKLAPESPEVWRVQGDIMAANRQSSEAEKAYRKALSLGDDPETRLSLAQLWVPLQRYHEIIAICAPILKAGNSPDISVEQRAQALLYTAGGRLYDPLTPAELATVQAQLQEVDSLSVQLPEGQRFLPPYFLGESYLRAGKPKEAIPYLERSVQAGPMFAGSLYSLARAYRLVGDIAKSDAATARHTHLSRILSELDMYNSRLQQRPGDAETLLRLADTLTEAGSTADAAQIYQRLISQGKFVEIAQRKLKALPSH